MSGWTSVGGPARRLKRRRPTTDEPVLQTCRIQSALTAQRIESERGGVEKRRFWLAHNQAGLSAYSWIGARNQGLCGPSVVYQGCRW
jgi:hypothetical protein